MTASSCASSFADNEFVGALRGAMKTDTDAQGDIDALTALNREYIHSVQHGDVRRFAEILADDFPASAIALIIARMATDNLATWAPPFRMQTTVYPTFTGFRFVAKGGSTRRAFLSNGKSRVACPTGRRSRLLAAPPR
jgi:hypothetical protein